MGTKQNPGQFDCYNAAEPDEPMFVLLARDETAGALVTLWAALRIGDSATADECMRTLKHIAAPYAAQPDLAKAMEASECAAAMTEWISEHRPGKLTPATRPPRVRTGDVLHDALPSCTRGAPIGYDFFIPDGSRDATGEAGFELTALSNAVQIWTAMQGMRPNLAAIARVFNCKPEIIAEAVRAHCWLALETESGALIDATDRETGAQRFAAIDDYSKVYVWHEGE